MPLTSGAVTIKATGGTYSTWAAFWNDLGNLTGNITCTVDSGAYTEATAPAAVTESLGGFTLWVKPASFPTTTDASTGARFTCNYSGNFCDMQMEGAGTVIIEGMTIINGTSAPGHVFLFQFIFTNFALTLRRNIIKGCGYGFYSDASYLLGIKVYNNIFYDTLAYACIRPNCNDATAVIANNTVVNCARGFYAADELITFENNLAYGSNSKDYTEIETLTKGNNNADSDATGQDADWGGGGANNVSSISDPFNVLASDDFTITAAGVIGTAGKDLSASFTDDFFGTTRVNWTIGACEWIDPTVAVSLSAEASLSATTTDKSPVSLTAEASLSATAIDRHSVSLLSEALISATATDKSPVSLSCEALISVFQTDTAPVSLSCEALLSVTSASSIIAGTGTSNSVLSTYASLNINAENTGLITRF